MQNDELRRKELMETSLLTEIAIGSKALILTSSCTLKKGNVQTREVGTPGGIQLLGLCQSLEDSCDKSHSLRDALQTARVVSTTKRVCIRLRMKVTKKILSNFPHHGTLVILFMWLQPSFYFS